MVIAVHSQTASLTVTQEPRGAPIASFAGGALTLLGAAECTLPPSFVYCGAAWVETACRTGGAAYAGACETGDRAPPKGCRGDDLFDAPAEQGWSTASKVLVSAVAVAVAGALAVAGAAGGAVAVAVPVAAVAHERMLPARARELPTLARELPTRERMLPTEAWDVRRRRLPTRL